MDKWNSDGVNVIRQKDFQDFLSIDSINQAVMKILLKFNYFLENVNMIRQLTVQLW